VVRLGAEVEVVGEVEGEEDLVVADAVVDADHIQLILYNSTNKLN
jgi:uncharacterized protein (UPF0218 family)